MLDEKYLIALVTPLVAAVLGRISDAISDWTDSLVGSKFSSSSLEKAAALICCSEWDDDVEARVALLERERDSVRCTKGKGLFLIEPKLFSGQYGWEEIGKGYGWSFQKTLAVSSLRFFFWHLLQPLFFFVSFYFYFDVLSGTQFILACLVVANEALYFLAACACLWLNPAFLLANVKDSDFLMIVMYVFTPNYYVWGCFSGALTQSLENFCRNQKKNRKASSPSSWYEISLRFFSFLLVGSSVFFLGVCALEMAAADVSALVALILDYQFHNLPLPLGIGCTSSCLLTMISVHFNSTVPSSRTQTPSRLVERSS